MGKYDNYNQEVTEKAKLVRQSHPRPPHKKGQPIPSEKELRKMNGPETTYQLNMPMTRGEFATMSDVGKRLYIEGIIEKYHISAAAIAEMLGYEKSIIYRLFKRLGIPRNCSGKGRAAAQNNERFFKEFCGKDTTQKPAGVEAKALSLNSFTLELEGEITTAALAEALARFIPEGYEAKISIAVALSSTQQH